MASEKVTKMETEETTMKTEQTTEGSNVVHFKFHVPKPGLASPKFIFTNLKELCNEYGEAFRLFYDTHHETISGEIQLKTPCTMAEARDLLNLEGADICDVSEAKKDKDYWKDKSWAETKIDGLLGRRVKAVKDKKKSKKDIKDRLNNLLDQKISLKVTKNPDQKEDHAGFFIPQNTAKQAWNQGETDIEKEQRLEEEKKEDQEFEKQLNIQLKRKIRDNPDKSYCLDSFGSGVERKSISQKVQDLLNDPGYPECFFNFLNEERLELNKQLDEMKEQKNKAEKMLKQVNQDLSEILPHIKKLADEKKLNEKHGQWVEELLENEELKRQSWTLYAKEKNAATDPFEKLRKICYEYCKKFALVQNGNTKSITGEIFLKEPMNVVEISELLGADVYINGEPKEDEQQEKKWKMVTRFREHDSLNIDVVDWKVMDYST